MKRFLFASLLFVACTALGQETPATPDAPPEPPPLRQWVAIDGIPTGFILAEYHADTDSWSWQNMLYHQVKMPVGKEGLKTTTVYIAIQELPQQAGIPEGAARTKGVAATPAPKPATSTPPSTTTQAAPTPPPLHWDAAKNAYVDPNGNPPPSVKSP